MGPTGTLCAQIVERRRCCLVVASGTKSRTVHRRTKPSYSDRYFLELRLHIFCTELLLVLRAPIELLLKKVPRNSLLLFHTLTPAHFAETIQVHACRLGIENLFALKGKDTHLHFRLPST